MRYGRRDFCFFSDGGPSQSKVAVVYDSFVSVARCREDGRLLLEAGHAHGVYQGDEYAVYPFDTPEDQTEPGTPSKTRVRSVGTLTSELEVVDSPPHSSMTI